MPEWLTPNQKKIYNCIKDHLEATGDSPTLAELAEVMNVKSLRSISQYLDALARKGLISRNRYAWRGIRLIESEGKTDLVSVPVFASAGCGQPSLIAERSFDEYVSVSSDLLGKHSKSNTYLIRAVGDSMIDAGITDGDLVLTERVDVAVDNDLVVAIIDDTAVIKRITHTNNAIILSPVTTSAEYKPIIMRKDFPIFGKVIDVLKTEPEEYRIIPTEDEHAENYTSETEPVRKGPPF